MPIPIEVKSSSNVHKTELKGLKVFMKEHVSKNRICDLYGKQSKAPGADDDREIIIYPLSEFLEKLWNKELLNE